MWDVSNQDGGVDGAVSRTSSAHVSHEFIVGYNVKDLSGPFDFFGWDSCLKV